MEKIQIAESVSLIGPDTKDNVTIEIDVCTPYPVTRVVPLKAIEKWLSSIGKQIITVTDRCVKVKNNCQYQKIYLCNKACPLFEEMHD